MPTRYIDLTTDFGFKRIFGRPESKNILKHFLFDMLDLPHPIEDITYIPKEQIPDWKSERIGIYDVHCTDTSGRRFMVEMQKHWQKYFRDRTIYYLALSITQQAIKGKWDYQLMPVYCVSIANFHVGEEDVTPTYLHPVQLMNTEQNTVFFDKLKLVYVELPYFKKEQHELTTNIDRWLYTIRHSVKLNKLPESLSTPPFEELFKSAEFANLEEEDQASYLENIKRERDHYSIMTSNIKKARKEGHEKGMQQGMQQTQIETAHKMLAKGMDISLIAELTVLSVDEIMKL